MFRMCARNSHSCSHLILALGIVREPTVWGFITSQYPGYMTLACLRYGSSIFMKSEVPEWHLQPVTTGFAVIAVICSNNPKNKRATEFDTVDEEGGRWQPTHCILMGMVTFHELLLIHVDRNAVTPYITTRL